MKSRIAKKNGRRRWAWVPPLGLCALAPALGAAETNDLPAAASAPAAITPEQTFEGGTNTFNNWIDFSAGGFFTTGNKSRAKQKRGVGHDLFGGIEDFHYMANVDKTTTLAVDGRSLFDNNDYKLSLDLQREKRGFLKFSYSEFRTWSSGDGGYYRPTDSWYPLSGNALALDRGEISLEGGLAYDKAPRITFKYLHSFREGEKGSTAWGIAHPDLGVTQGLAPSFYDIHEHSDSFQVDIAHKIKKTDFGFGVRFDTGKLDDALKITQSPGEPSQQRITDRQGTSYDMFNAHAFTETWLKPNLMWSSGYSYSDLESGLSGSRIYGTDFDVGYVPAAQNGLGYYAATGGSRVHDYVMDLNLMYKPSPQLSIVPSLRVQEEIADSDISGLATLGANAATPFSAIADRNLLDVRERLDLTYSGVTNTVLYCRGDWVEGSGRLKENGGIGPVNGFGVLPVQRRTEDSRFFQKYSAGVRWYPAHRVVLDFGGYYKINRYDYDNVIDSTSNDPGSGNRYPAYLVMQDFKTYDGNVRLTLRPWQNVTTVSRYEYQISSIHSRPDAISGLSTLETSDMTSHILAQDISWTPFSRLNLQAGFNYVVSDTSTPASEVTSAVLKAQNNYWTTSLNSSLVLDEKSDLNVGYLYWQADNYSDNSLAGVPYGVAAHEHGVTATWVRRLSEHLRLSLRYGYFRYHDFAWAGRDDFSSHVIYSTLRYRF